MNYWLIFLTGLTSGGVSCAAMQGGILASIIANQKVTSGSTQKDPAMAGKIPNNGLGSDDYLPVASFLFAKLISHVMLGILLGWLGSSVELSLNTRLIFQLFAALFMLASAFNLLELHPIFRYLAFTPPRFVARLIKNAKHSTSIFAPAIFGFLTIFIPCGVTQAMAVVAIATGNPLSGALIMGSFLLGTIPIFAVIGLATARLSEAWQSIFLRLAAILLIALSLYSFNGILVALDSPYSLTRIVTVIRTPITTTPLVATESGLQKVEIKITSAGYTPNKFAVKAGIPVELKVSAGEVYSCATAFTFRAFGINANLRPNTNQVFTFTPNKKGLYTFSCSMGMYSGTMEVI